MRLAVLSDLLEEQWPSMDLVTDMLVEHVGRQPGVEVSCIRPTLPRGVRELASRGGARPRFARPLGVAIGRYALYPLELPKLRARFDHFHVADHSYAHLALGLPRERTGVFCHDIDAFRPLLDGGRRGWRKALARTLLAGLRRAAVVFYSTEAVRSEIEEHHLVDVARLVAAPYGIAEEFQPEARAEDALLRARPRYLLHVGSLIPRKNPHFLLKVFVAARRALPNIELVQIGGEWDSEARALIAKEGLTSRVHQLRGITREELAAYYRSAIAVLLPSTSEGFGLPVIEALACGASVVASDIPVLRQVGGDGVSFRAVGDPDAWRDAIVSAFEGRGPDLSRRLLVASRYTWTAHAATITSAYAGLGTGRA